MSFQKDVTKDLKLGVKVGNCDYCYLFHTLTRDGHGKQVHIPMACNHALGVKVRFLQERLTGFDELVKSLQERLSELEELVTPLK